jgi:hypothetical protein
VVSRMRIALYANQAARWPMPITTQKSDGINSVVCSDGSA